MVHDKCLGRLGINLDKLLECQRQQADDGECILIVKGFYYNWRISKIDVILTLTDKRGNPSNCRLTIRITQQSTSAVVGTAVEQALVSAKSLTRLHIINAVPDAVASLTDTASNQQSLVTSFGSLLDKVRILLMAGDEVAKVFSLLYSSLWHSPKIIEDTSLCQLCLASTLCRTQGMTSSFTRVVCVYRYISIE
jgi:hypothetical protein